MNERILSPQLLKLVQAAGPGYSQADPEWVKKFAELIVQECISCCDEVSIKDFYVEDGPKECIEVIKEHFGVEQ